jgi:hypothetical protein
MRKATGDGKKDKYLHRDFHISMNMLMRYILSRYGSEGLDEYLTRFARRYHAPLNEKIKREGLAPLAEYIRDVYEKEEGHVDIKEDDGILEVEQKACPGISHIRKAGHEPVEGYFKTYRIIYGTICEDTPYDYELEYFDNATGACRQVFKRGAGR